MRTQDALRERIYELCRKNRMTITGIAKASGITQSTLSNITRGRNNSTTVATIKKLCDGIGMELPEFFNSDLFRNLEQEMI